jgi:hypothetical protein
LEKIEKEADNEIDNLRQKQNKKQEFPAEEDLELEIGTQNTKVDAMITGLKELIQVEEENEKKEILQEQKEIAAHKALVKAGVQTKPSTSTDTSN